MSTPAIPADALSALHAAHPTWTAAIISGPDARTGTTRHHLVVAYQPSRTCGRCGEPIRAWHASELGCVNPSTGDLDTFSRQHGCGEWDRVIWAHTRIGRYDDEDDIRATLDWLVAAVTDNARNH